MNTSDIKQVQIDIARWFIRVGLAFVYGYAAVETQLSPANFLKYVPPIMQAIIPVDLFLVAFGIFEMILTIWLLSGKHTEYAGLISFALMMSIIFPNMAYFPVLFRNIAIASASLALFALDYHKQKNLKI